MVSVCQDFPPLVVPMTTPALAAAELWPTTVQIVADEQAMALTAEIASGMLCALHVVPPLVVPMTTPASVPLWPTASQIDVDLHETALRAFATAGYDTLTLQAGSLDPATAGSGASTPTTARTAPDNRALPSRASRDLDRWKAGTSRVIPLPRSLAPSGTRHAPRRAGRRSDEHRHPNRQTASASSRDRPLDAAARRCLGIDVFPGTGNPGAQGTGRPYSTRTGWGGKLVSDRFAVARHPGFS